MCPNIGCPDFYPEAAGFSCLSNVPFRFDQGHRLCHPADGFHLGTPELKKMEAFEATRANSMLFRNLPHVPIDGD